TKAKKNAFKDTAYGILKAGEKYVAEALLESENTYEGETIILPNHDKLDYKGQEPLGGKMSITKDGDISLVINNDSWCAIKTAEDKDVKIEKYDKNTCKIKLPLKGLAKIISDKNTNGNTEGLFTDDYENIRYRGSNSEVKNYVTFNGETWRIIGVFEGKVKLIKNNVFGGVNWDSGNKNNWDTSSLKEYLNGNYYNGLNNLAKDQIETSVFYLGGHDTTEGIYSKEIYLKERGTAVSAGNPTKTTQNIGLMYPSDYGYAARSICDESLSSYARNAHCSSEGNWLYKGFDEWLQTPSSGSPYYAVFMYSSGYLYIGFSVSLNCAIRPSLFLKSTVNITGGDGTEANPYIIS
ncbi:MAG: hypothetical protein KH135_02385, partial [Firmicutes bacterium]|nr:hypothetical protein [Bacillota bacterium]